MTAFLVTHTAVPRSSRQCQRCLLWYNLTLEFDLFPSTAVSTPASMTLRETSNKPFCFESNRKLLAVVYNEDHTEVIPVPPVLGRNFAHHRMHGVSNVQFGGLEETPHSC